MPDRSQPKVSVLMSVYNGADYLRESMDSILSQSSQDFELVIVDDGSTDGTSSILAGYADPRIVLLSNPTNLGLTRSLNRALDVCQGDFIARHDADDTSHPSRLEKQVDFMENHSEVGVLGTQMDVVDQSGKLLYKYEVPCRHSMIVWTLFFDRAIAHPTVIIRRSLIEEIGGYDTSFRYAQDFDLWTRLAGNTKFANLSETLYFYKDRADSVSHCKQDGQYATIISATRRLIEMLTGQDCSPDLVEWLRKSQLPGMAMTLEQAEAVVRLILKLKQTMLKSGLIKAAEIKEVQADMIKRVAAVVGHFNVAAKDNLPDNGPYQTLSRPWQLVKKAIANPRRAGYIVQHRLKRAFADLTETFAASARLFGTGLNQDSPGKGLTVIVLSYERMRSLSALLESLLRQQLGNLDLELLVCNNSPRVNLNLSRFSKMGRLLSRFKGVRIFNSSYNWRCRVRYGLATLASHDLIMFIDDDIVMLDPQFIRYMFETYQTLGPMDILSCWNTLWVEWERGCFKFVPLTWNNPDLREVTQTDTVGAGICMFSKQLVYNPRIQNMTEEFPRADDMAFSLVAALEWGSKNYYLPSYGMLKMHDQQVVNALNSVPGHYETLYDQYLHLIEEGYQPVLKNADFSCDAPALWAAKNVPLSTYRWT